MIHRLLLASGNCNHNQGPDRGSVFWWFDHRDSSSKTPGPVLNFPPGYWFCFQYMSIRSSLQLTCERSGSGINKFHSDHNLVTVPGIIEYSHSRFQKFTVLFQSFGKVNGALFPEPDGNIFLFTNNTTADVNRMVPFINHQCERPGGFNNTNTHVVYGDWKFADQVSRDTSSRPFSFGVAVLLDIFVILDTEVVFEKGVKVIVELTVSVSTVVFFSDRHNRSKEYIRPAQG